MDRIWRLAGEKETNTEAQREKQKWKDANYFIVPSCLSQIISSEIFGISPVICHIY